MIKQVLSNRIEGILGYNGGVYNKGSLDLWLQFFLTVTINAQVILETICIQINDLIEIKLTSKNTGSIFPKQGPNSNAEEQKCKCLPHMTRKYIKI